MTKLLETFLRPFGSKPAELERFQRHPSQGKSTRKKAINEEKRKKVTPKFSFLLNFVTLVLLQHH